VLSSCTSSTGAPRTCLASSLLFCGSLPRLELTTRVSAPRFSFSGWRLLTFMSSFSAVGGTQQTQTSVLGLACIGSRRANLAALDSSQQPTRTPVARPDGGAGTEGERGQSIPWIVRRSPDVQRRPTACHAYVCVTIGNDAPCATARGTTTHWRSVRRTDIVSFLCLC
jgi:hypothetical protein